LDFSVCSEVIKSNYFFISVGIVLLRTRATEIVFLCTYFICVQTQQPRGQLQSTSERKWIGTKYLQIK
jgi:hypothetical protein